VCVLGASLEARLVSFDAFADFLFLDERLRFDFNAEVVAIAEAGATET
jgi:hypothetical protein